MNGSSSGIVPTVDLATNNNGGFAYPYPVMAGFGGNSGFGGFGSDSAIWLIVLLALIWGGNNGNNGGFFGGNNSFDNGYAWLSNGQKEIMNNTNNGFDTLHLSNQIEGVRDGVYGLSNQICSSTGDITQAINSGFSSAEISANSRQMANMQQAFNSEINTLNGFNNINTALQNCCCENRLGIANLGSDIAREACATRTNDTQNTQTLLNTINGGIQSIKDQLCQDKIDQKNDEISQLRQEILYARGQASQVSQTADIVNSTYQRLRDCPIESTPIYGRIPIFTCNGGCGCGMNTTSQFI